MAQLGARDDGRAVLLLFVLLVLAQQTGVLHALVLGFILLTCTRVVLFCIALGAQLAHLQHEDAATQRTLLTAVLTHSGDPATAAGAGGQAALDPLLLQLRLLDRDIDPRDYEALLALGHEALARGHSRGLTAEQLAALPRHTVRATGGGDAQAAGSGSGGGGGPASVVATTCAICLEDAEQGDTLCALPCAHQFHDACIGRWLATSTLCPVCKQDVVPAEPAAGE